MQHGGGGEQGEKGKEMEKKIGEAQSRGISPSRMRVANERALIRGSQTQKIGVSFCGFLLVLSC